MEFLTKNIETPKEKREQAKKIHDMVSAINSRDPTQDELIELCKISGIVVCFLVMMINVYIIVITIDATGWLLHRRI